jgi:hypothetical protein
MIKAGWCATVAGGAICLALLVPAGAQGGTTGTLSIGYFSGPDNSQGFLGYVNSSKGTCEVRRTVSVFRKRPGGDIFVGKDRSERESDYGIYSFEVDQVKRPATYYAKAPARPGCDRLRSEDYFLCAPSQAAAARDCRVAARPNG